MAKRDAVAVKYETKGEAAVTRERKQTIIDRELDALYKSDGKVAVTTLLDRASDPRNPLHKFFEWDDSVAGQKWREHQALQIIQSSKFVCHLVEGKAPPAAAGKGTEVRRLVSAFRGEGFKMRNEALADGDQRKVIVERKLGELRGWLRGTVDLDELKEIRAAIARLLDSV